MSTIESHRTDQPIQSSRLPWEEPVVTFERWLMAEAQGGPGPHGAPSGLLGPLSASGTTVTNACL